MTTDELFRRYVRICDFHGTQSERVHAWAKYMKALRADIQADADMQKRKVRKRQAEAVR